MTLPHMAAVLAGACLTLAGCLAIIGGRRRSAVARTPATPERPAIRRLRVISAAFGDPVRSRPARRRAAVWAVVGVAIWVISGWPVAGVAVVVAGLWLPWLLGSARVVQDRIATLEALETWCRRMADTLAGGGAIGLAQAIATTAARVEEPIATAVRTLARRMQTDNRDPAAALREFADAVDDRTGDAVAAALLLALNQQSTGIAQVLRQLADGVARDVRARREIEAARAESRQSIRMLLVIQAGLLVLLALVPTFAAPYGTPVGQAVMAILLGGTAALLIWMRRLSLGKKPPRFFGVTAGAS
ncbi:Flp pilus assembly protein TadB [Pseudonocardia sediminis]|uniref:Flp pilus assembly protein TadB n=1 Tax=Pseudonocardia sediminis TaxID=1397368 RepID=A0A4Q7UZ68_PSEST|nr:Flp pilus assembly protein TadB [Pseudonocardia sediminis]